MDDLQRLSINQLTTRDQWSLPEAVDGYARAGVGAMAVWWEKLREVGVERAAKTIRDADMRVTGYCVGGQMSSCDPARWQAQLDDNRRMVDEAAAIGASCLVAIGGGLDAVISHQIISGNKISPAFNQQVFAIVTVSVVALMFGHVAHIDIVNPFGHGQFPESRQGRDRSRG